MEQNHRVKLTTSNSFVLEQEEIKRLYTYLSLFQYRYLRTPDYCEQVLIQHLEKDFKKYYVEMQKQAERDPNNLVLSKIRAFFDNHNKHLKRLVEEYCSED